MSDWASLIGGVASLAGAGAGLYSAISSSNTASNLSDAYLQGTNDTSAMAKEQWNQWKSTYLPLEERKVEVAMSDIDKTEEYKPKYWEEVDRNLTMFRGIEDSIVQDAEQGVDGQELADKASTDVQQAFDTARDAEGRSLTRMGVNPNSGRYAAFSDREKNSRALAEAGARTQAFRDADTLTDQKRAAAMNLKMGTPMPQTQGVDGSSTLNSAMSGMQSAANNLGAAADSAASSAAQDWAATGYLTNKLTNDIDWDAAGNAWSSLWN